MKSWKDVQGEVQRVKPDIEMAASILKMMEIRKEATELLDKEKFASLKVESYYEIIKEGITALMAIDGYKTLSHEVLISYLNEFHRRDFLESDTIFLDQLRQLRNKIVYKGFFVQIDYLDRNEVRIKTMVKKLIHILQIKLKSK